MTPWFYRYMYVASFNLIIAVSWTILFLIPDLNLPKIIASGWPGTWLFIGYILLVIIGCPGMVLCGTVNYILSQLHKTLNNNISWLHIVLTEVGVIGSTVFLSVAGYVGGRLALEKQSIPFIHENIVGYVIPTTIFVLIAVVGILLAVANLLLAFAKKPTQ